MADHARAHPGYGWETNKGYPTPEHQRALAALGVTPLHRRSFAPVRLALGRGSSEPIAIPAKTGIHESERPICCPDVSLDPGFRRGDEGDPVSPAGHTTSG